MSRTKVFSLMNISSLTAVFLVYALVFSPRSLGARKSDLKQLQSLYRKALNEEVRTQRITMLRQLVDLIARKIGGNASHPQLSDLLYLLASSHEQLCDFKKATTYYKEVADLFPFSKYKKSSRYKIDLIKKAQSGDKKMGVEPLKLYLEQERLSMLAKYEEAVLKCRELLENYPRSVLVDNTQNVIAYIYFNYIKNYTQARKEYQKLLEKYPQSSFKDNALFGIGRCYERLELYQSSIVIYQYLKGKHETLGYASTNYWSRVWFTRAGDRIENISSYLASNEDEPYIQHRFRKINPGVKVSGKRGKEDKTPQDMKSWIRPQEVRSTVSSIKGNNPILALTDPEKARILRIWNYVMEEYQYQYTASMTPDFWQYPRETIAKKLGDCCDLSILLASLLIADGANRDNVRVILGRNKNGEKHSWVNVSYQGKWYLLETSWRYGVQENLYLAKHEGNTPIYGFNDQVIEQNPDVPANVLTAILN